MLSVDNMEPAAAVATLRQALEGLSALSTQRAALEEALKVRWLLGLAACCAGRLIVVMHSSCIACKYAALAAVVERAFKCHAAACV
jgi:hypothetical protein